MDNDAKSLIFLAFTATITASFILGLVWVDTQQDLNTVTIHKQDRLSLPCPQGGE
ncbi:hypothetical protein AB1P65_09390 [Roseibium alexandrii]